jgi:hypothetical protein
MPVELSAERLRVDQPQLVRLVHGRFQLARAEKGGEIEQGPARARHWDLVETAPIALPQVTTPVHADSLPAVALGSRDRNIDH